MKPKEQKTGATSETLALSHKEIADVIFRETLAFQRRDYSAWQDCWVHEERTQDVYISSTAGLSALRGWTAISTNMKKFFDDDRWSEIDEFGQENLCVSESGDMAWAVYDGWARFRDGGRAHTYETRILEKLNGCWKIAYSSFAIRQGGAAIGLSVSLDGEGRIVASNEVSLAALKTHPHLTVSAGKLRARRLSWDKNLQRAISDAARHHGFFETHKYEIQMGRSPVYPVILGQSDDGGVAVVHFSIKDGVTNIRIDADDFLERRLRYAQVVFGLSDGQIRIARHIAMGDSLRRLSLKLDISSNTARTHLTRMYEKTGVNSQAALVRLLLSVG